MRRNVCMLSVLVICIIFSGLVAGCAGADKNILSSDAQGQNTVSLPSDTYTPAAVQKAGDFSVTLKVGWNNFKYPAITSKKFTGVTITYNGETKLLKDAMPAWTQNKIRYLKGRAIVQVDTNSTVEAFQQGVQYYVYSSLNKAVLDFNKPFISAIEPASAVAGTSVTLSGVNFGAAQGAVTFTSGKAAAISEWSDTRIVCSVPDGVETGPVGVLSHGRQSNQVAFTVSSPVAADYFVSVSTGSDENPGTLSQPFKTVTKAMSVASSGKVILVAEGTYSAAAGEIFPISLLDGVQLTGGYNTSFTTCSPKTTQTILDAELANGVIDIPSGNATRLSGFVIRNGKRPDDPMMMQPGPGGGIACYGSPVISDCILTGNTGSEGGAIYFYNYDGGSPQVLNCTISANTGWGGGAIMMVGGTAEVVNCLFYGNETTCGGALHITWNAAPRIHDCTFFGNSAYNGGAIYMQSGAAPIITNTIVSQNTAANGGGIYAEYNVFPITFCNFWGNTPNDAYKLDTSGGVEQFSGWGWDGSGCIASDPLFVDTAGNNFNLQTGSLSIDTGANALIPVGITTDLNGNPRIVNLIVDMGAYEKQ